MKITKAYLYATGSALAAAFSFGTADIAAAQDAASQQAGSIEEVVVVARKREESLQSVPVAVSALSSDTLARQSLDEPTDLSRTVPSLTIVAGASSPSGAIISLRGQVASDVLLTLSQPVGLYEDSVNIPHPVGANIAFFDLAQVEVLKGPQGTLYGRNTTGGAINILTRNADSNGFHGFVSLEAGNYGDLKYAAAINVPIIEDMLAGRLAYQHWDRDGYGESAITGQKLGGDHDDDVIRGSLSWNPTPWLTGSFKAEYTHADRADALYQTRQLDGTNPALAAFGIPAPYYAVDAEWILQGRIGGVLPSTLVARSGGDLFTNYSSTIGSEELEAWHGVADISWDITDNITLRSITGWHKFEDFRNFDLDALPLQGYEVGFGTNAQNPFGGTAPRPTDPDQESQQVTQEFNLSGQAVDGRFDWLVGAFYSNDEGSGAQTASGGTPALASAALGFPFFAVYDSRSVQNQSWALFTQNDFKFNDVVSVTLGARYTEERLKQDVAAYLFDARNAPLAARYQCLAGPGRNQRFLTDDGCSIDQTAKFSGTSYLGSLNLQFTPGVLVYLRTARGFRGGALQVRAPTFPAAAPEIATDYEIGLKGDFFNRRLRTNLAVYQTNYENKQETAIIVDPATGVANTPIVNAASARIRGFEGEITALPIDNLTLTANITYLDGQYLDYPFAVTPTGTVNGSGAAFAAPNWSYNIGARYVVEDVGPGELGFQANYAWRGKVNSTVLNNDARISRALLNEWREERGLLSASIDYTLVDQGLTFSVFGTNLTDEEYQSQALTFSGFGFTGTTQEPLMWGVSVRKTFGDE